MEQPPHEGNIKAEPVHENRGIAPRDGGMGFHQPLMDSRHREGSHESELFPVPGQKPSAY